MRVFDETMSDQKEVENEGPVTEIKVPRAKIRVTSHDRTPSASPIRKITIRQSSEDNSKQQQQANYEIISQNHSKQMEVLTETPTMMKLARYEIQPAQSPINNGLDPVAMDLISSTGIPSSIAGSEYSDKSDDTYGSPKISREMKNLQKSTNNSKILSDYLMDESPRRSRKTKEIPLPDPDEDIEEVEEEVEEEEEEELKEMKHSPVSVTNENVDSDTTLILPMEPPENRRKSVSRSRSRARSSNVRGRKKSIARQLKDELLLTSDKDEAAEEEEEEDQMSEVSYITNRSLEGRAVNPPPKPGWDSFCFKCHADNAVLSLACSKCKCSYHRHCVRPNPIPKNVDEFVCPECSELETAESSNFNKYGHDKIDPNTLADMLTIILEKIRTYPDRKHFEDDIVLKTVKEPTQPLIVKQMSLKILESRIKSRFYKVTESFIHDIKQLEHNWNIVDRSKTKTLKTIVKYVNTEINELEACVFCYEKSFVSSDWFVEPCKRPHLLIWAKLKGYPYWPAKVMSIDMRQHVDVRFFGAHDRAWVPAAHCMLFSEKDPNKTKGSTPTNAKNTSKTQKGIADAMKEKDDYIENLRKEFGFKYSTFRQQLDPENLQSQLEFMLPALKNNKDEKELDGAQKEKLTLKIIKGQSSNYQVEQKSAEIKTPTAHKQGEKDRPKLYKVLSKTDDNTTQEQPGKLSLIIKRKSNVEQESSKSKKSRVSDTASETSESNASVQSGGRTAKRQSSIGIPKHRKKTSEKEPIADPPVGKKTKHSEKQKAQNEDIETLLDEVAKTKTMRRNRVKSVFPESDKPLLVKVVIPPGTDEIETLREVSKSPPSVRTNNRSRSCHRSRSTEKETTIKDLKEQRRVSITTGEVTIKRSASDGSRKNSIRVSVSDRPPTPMPSAEPTFDPNLVIKDEPMSDHEEAESVAQPDSYTLRDIPNLMQDKSGKKKLIVISTTEESREALAMHQNGRARKTFPNHPNQRQLDALKSHQLQQGQNGDNWMVCIPQALAGLTGNAATSPPTSNRSTPASESQISISQVRSAASSARATPTASTASSSVAQTSTSRSSNPNVPPLNYSAMPSPGALRRRNSVQSNSIFVNGQRTATANVPPLNLVQQRKSSGEPPRLAPRPQGVFVSDGTTFNRDIGPVSRVFTDNAHRMSDFFRTVLIDTVAAFAPETPTAENLMLRFENEKIQREMQITKSDCQHKMQELRREHQDEIESIKKSYEDRIAGIHQQIDQEKARMIAEIRHQCEIEKQRAIELTRKETKKTTWCSNCTKEARFYCCWNTSYCGPQCQKTHWQIHQKYCTNKNSVSDTQVQQACKQTNTETQVVLSRPTFVIKSPQQLQQPPTMSNQHAPPVSIQQHIILPSGPIMSSGNSIISTLPITTQSFILGTYQNKGNAVRTIFQEQTAPTNLIVKTIHRHDSPSLNVISKEPLNESLMINAAPTNMTE